LVVSFIASFANPEIPGLPWRLYCNLRLIETTSGYIQRGGNPALDQIAVPLILLRSISDRPGRDPPSLQGN